MRFRPANIRLINRRSNLPRLLLALSSKNGKSNSNDKNNPTDVQQLTGSLHIRAVPESSCPAQLGERWRFLEENATWHTSFWVQQFWNRCAAARRFYPHKH
jgi:hypothetical protein